MFSIAIILIIHACYKRILIGKTGRAKARLFIFPKKFEKSRKVYIFVKSLPKL